MEFILDEAEERSDYSQEGGEEEENLNSLEDSEDDTGIGTYSQLFEADTENDSPENRGSGSSPETSTPDLSSHRLLLRLQREEDSEAAVSKLVNTSIGKRARTPTPRKHDNPVSGSEQLSPGLQALHIRNGNIPETVCRKLEYKNTEKSNTLRDESYSGTAGPLIHEGQVQPTNHPSKRSRGPLTGCNAIQPIRNILSRSNDSVSIRHALTNNSGISLANENSESLPGSNQEKERGKAPDSRKTKGEELLQRCLTAKNTRHTVLAIFKELYTASYSEVTRTFKSDKTQSPEWVFIVLGAAQVFYEALCECLKAITEFILFDILPKERIGLFYCGFLASKNRDGLRRCLKCYNVNPNCVVLADPPNKRSVLAALFFQKLALGHGELPLWCKDILSSGELAGEGFELSKMVQWALDNHMYDEGTISYNYALLAETDINAQLWLKSNSQAKYVRDAAAMVRNYSRGRLHAMSMNEHLAVRMREYCDEDEEEGWKKIIVFLRFQHVIIKDFLRTLSLWFKGRPKKSTIGICGVSDSGKSMFTMSLIVFLDGKVLSFNNNRSHFWLQPLSECKCAIIDDVTMPCWEYFNTYLRNALDGNPICIDCKHRAPLQLKCPPIILTSNYDPKDYKDGYGECTYKYLLSRITFFYFTRVIPIIGGNPRFLIHPGDWRSFIIKYKEELEIDLQDLDYGQTSADTGGPTGEGS